MDVQPQKTSMAHVAFHTTHWSVVRGATAADSPATAQALESLCAAYWPPLYAYARRAGLAPPDAQDAIQDFLNQLLQRNALASVSPAKGKFRSWLLAGLKNFLVSRVRREQSLKRGGQAERIHLDAEEAAALCQGELANQLSPDRTFDRRWAETIVERALHALREEHTGRGKARSYEILKPLLVDGAEENYAALGRDLAMTPGAVAVAVHRMRLRFRELVRAEVAQTVGSATELDEEMRSLFAALSR